jgi:hypothetical protein
VSGWCRRGSVVLLVALGVLSLWGGSLAGASTRAHQPGPLRAPKTTTAQDAQYLTDVAQADSDLYRYVQTYGNTALRGMVTDGLAFCAFLRRDGSIDGALVDVATGARNDEHTTHLPLSVHTFNTLESLALIDLCPGEQSLVPSSVRSELRQLRSSLRASSRSVTP